MTPLPRITIVTPSFNQAPFLRDTIESVLGQGYPDLEYMILDGGSTDGSVEVIKEYANRLAYWCSEPDGGQAAAINKGFARATGSILAWLNSDDYYLPGTLRHVAETLDAAKPEILLGNCMHFHEDNPHIRGSDVPLRHQQLTLSVVDYIIQPSSFWTRATWDQTGPLDANFHFTFDWDWYIRAFKSGAEVKTTPRYLSAYRVHAGHKTGTGGDKRDEEIDAIHLKYGGPRQVKLHQDCRTHARKIGRVRNWAKSLGLTPRVPLPTLLKWFLPGIFSGVSDQDIRSMLGLVTKDPSKKSR